MAFTRSQRFSDTATCAPPPTAYQLPTVFDETNCSTLTAPSYVHPHIEASSGASPCSTENKENVCCVQKKDVSKFTKNSIVTEPKAPSYVHPHIEASSGASPGSTENKENVCCVQKKDVSKFTKNSIVTEPKAPSFMTRRYTIHNCLTNNTEENDLPKSNFNRNSLKRKSMKIIKEKKEKTPEKLDSSLSPSKSAHTSNLQANKHLNVSYTVIPEKQSKESTSACPAASDNNKGAISKTLRNITDDMKQNESINNLDFGSTEDNAADSTDYSNLEDSSDKILLEKGGFQKVFLNDLGNKNKINVANDKSIKAECLNSFLPENSVDYVKIDMDNSVESIRHSINHNTCFKSSTSLTDTEGHVVFLLTDEFIDDEFDSYVGGCTLEQKHTTRKDSDITKMCKSLVQLHMEKLSVKVSKKKVNLRRNKSRVKKGSQNVAKKRTSINSTNMLENELEKIVRSAINNLKEEFKKEVYKRTEEKVDALMSKLAGVLLNADESISNKCEHTASELINKLKIIID